MGRWGRVTLIGEVSQSAPVFTHGKCETSVASAQRARHARVIAIFPYGFVTPRRLASAQTSISFYPAGFGLQRGRMKHLATSYR